MPFSYLLRITRAVRRKSCSVRYLIFARLAWCSHPVLLKRERLPTSLEINMEGLSLADILDCLAADQLWALLSMRVQLANSDQLQAQSAALRFGGLGRRYVLVAFNDRSVGLLSHADGSGLLPGARPKLTALSWEEIRLALMLDIGAN